MSRDGDYGVTVRKESLINDWLRHEFRERVGKQRKLLLTQYLAVAYDFAGIPTSEEEKKDERVVVEEGTQSSVSPTFIAQIDDILGRLSPEKEEVIRLRFGFPPGDAEGAKRLLAHVEATYPKQTPSGTKSGTSPPDEPQGGGLTRR